MRRSFISALGTAALIAPTLGCTADLRGQIESYRIAHEAQIVGELADLTRLRSIAAEPVGLIAAADHLLVALKARGFDAQLLSAGAGVPPIVFGALRSPGAKRTVVFYAHYDGQPVTPSQWQSDPFLPVMRSGPLSASPHDIDWKAGRLYVRGKDGQRLELPLLEDVGKAIAAYLRRGRPVSTSRRVFLRAKAPIRGFLGTGGIDSIILHALERAGIDSPTRGAHQFRHGLACEMLRHGASLSEIGQLLGHRHPQTTTIYAKVDLKALRTLALPWPGGVQ